MEQIGLVLVESVLVISLLFLKPMHGLAITTGKMTPKRLNTLAASIFIVNLAMILQNFLLILLIKKKLGFRTKMDVIPLDATLVKGSHGRDNVSESEQPIFIGMQSLTSATEVVQAIVDEVSGNVSEKTSF